MATIIDTDRLLDDEALVRRILGHVADDTTDLSAGTWTEPVANYRSEARLEAEIELVLRRQPTVFCPSAALPEVGSYLARDAAGVPLVAVRGRDGQVRVFRNACRHRATALASGSGCEKALVCPYHGWVYGLDGSLRHVPDEAGFPGLDKAAHGLVPVLCAQERSGLVFVAQDAGAPVSIAAREPAGAGADDPALPIGWLPELVGDDQELLGSDDLVVEANWKVLVEGFLEGYHIKATHRDTFLPFGYDNITVVESFGRHNRVTFPFRRIEQLRHRPPEEWRIDGMATVVHHVFPNTMVVGFSHHTLVVVLEPLTTDQTRFVTYRLAGPRPGADQRDTGRADAARRDVDFVALGAAEDLAVAVGVQQGLRAGANQVLTFGRFEGAIGHFHRQLHELLGSEPVAPPA